MDLKENYQRILHQLDCDARQTFTDIGKETGLSQQTVSYAIKTMQEDGVIRGFHPLFDYTKFGLNGYLVLFRVNAFSRRKIEELTELFENHGMVAWVHRLAGGWDFMVFFLAPNASYFNKEFKQLIAKHPEQLRKYTILTTIVIHDLGRNYLAENPEQEDDRDIIVGGDREIVEITDAQRETCRYLQENPRMSSVDMAEALNVTPKTVLDRIQTLQEDALINGYRPVLGISEIGVLTTLLLIQYNNRDVDKENELRDYCVRHPNITLFTKTFGDWDAVIRLETNDRSTQREIVNSIRERYEDILLDYDTLEIVEDIKKQYLPDDYFATDQ